MSRRDLNLLVATALAATASGRASAQTAPYGSQGVKATVIMEPDLAGFSPQTTRLTLVEIDGPPLTLSKERLDRGVIAGRRADELSQ